MIIVFLYLTFSLSIIPSSSIHVDANGWYSSFLMVEYYPIEYMNYIFFTHSSVEGHLGSFHSLAIVYIAAMNFGVQVPLQITTFDLWGKYLVVQLLGHRVVLFLPS